MTDDPKTGLPPGVPEGPWEWFGNAVGNELYLATTHSRRRLIMHFGRWGMQGAQPLFPVDGRMVAAEDLVTFEVGEPNIVGLHAARATASVYRYQINGIDHPVARLIAAAPDLYRALKLACEEIRDLRHHAGNNGAMIEEEEFTEGLAALAAARGEAGTAGGGEG